MPERHLPSDDRTPYGSSRPRPGHDRPWWEQQPQWLRWVLLVGAVVLGGLFLSNAFATETGQQLDYSEFVDRVEAGEVEQVTIDPEGRVRGELDDGTSFRTTIPTALRQEQLTQLLREQDVTIQATAPSDGGFGGLLLGLLPFLLLFGLLFLFIRRQAQGQLQQMRGISRSRAKVVDTERPDTRFDDVAGYDDVKEEIQEVIDFLKHPDRYRRAGARGPGGILLVGPPGTGKTLVARAVAGEADVPFIYATGSGFVEMLVGVGASRVRDLFKEARKRAPCIVFIDELDSVGRKRGGGATIGSNNEQEQTLNELLAEMDGFDPATGVVVMAATNRPNLLDEALLRPGRFDRQIVVPLPIQRDRAAILAVHTRDKQLADEVDLGRLAAATPGFSGADLENLCNEAAIFAVREGRQTITGADFDGARDRIMIGRRRDPSLLRPDEKRRVAVHEAGHALVAALADEADPVEKVSILPTGRALGVTHQVPIDERHLHAEGFLGVALAVRLGGRVAEQLVLGELSSGSAEDLRQATSTATKMVREFGFSPTVGPVGYPEDETTPPGLRARPFAEDTQRLIDEEVARLLREAEKRATEALEEHRHALEGLVERLLAEETVSGAAVYELVGRTPPRR